MQRRAPLAVLLWAGVVLIVLSLPLPWYSISGSSNQEQVSETFSISDAALSSQRASWTSSYSAAQLPHTGQLYELVSGIVLFAIFAGGLAGALLLLRWSGRERLIVLAICAVAMVLAALGPLLLIADQPIAVCADENGFSQPFGVPGNQTGPSVCTWEFYLGNQAGWFAIGGPGGPGASFVGHSAAYGSNLTWGPELGWYLSLFGASFIVVAIAPQLPTLLHPRIQSPGQ